MKIEEAEKIVTLYHRLESLSLKISHLHELRSARLTGLDPQSPGAAIYMQNVVKDHWSLFSNTFREYFIEQLDFAISNAEKEYSEIEEELKKL